jgi:hypothetical protein
MIKFESRLHNEAQKKCCNMDINTLYVAHYIITTGVGKGNGKIRQQRMGAGTEIHGMPVHTVHRDFRVRPERKISL